MRLAGAPFSDPRQLDAIDAQIAAKPDDLGLRFARACCLEEIGRVDEAVKAYVDLLTRQPINFGGLTNLGSLLLERGRIDEARPYLTAAATLAPAEPIALVNLAQLQAETGDADAAITTYTAAIKQKPDFLHAHLGLASIYNERGDDALAQAHLDLAFATPRAWGVPYRGTGEPIKVLMLVSAFGGEMITNLFLDDTVVQKGVILADSIREPLDAPPYHVLFNAIGDADRSRPSLERAIPIAAASAAAIINDPRKVIRTGRVETMQRLQGIGGLRAPRTERLPRTEVTAEGLAARGFTFPLLLRSPGHHAGSHFEAAETPAKLAGALAALPGRDILAIEYLDARGADADVRKYRVVAVDGVLYPVHLAIAPQWKVHYFSAEMSGRPDHRAEEARFLADMPGVVGARGMRALEEIIASMGLDYAGVDFGLDAEGTVLVFEANATMAVYPPEASELWNYRRRAIDRVIAAMRTLLVERARTVGYA